jgi:hypothetical protein
VTILFRFATSFLATAAVVAITGELVMPRAAAFVLAFDAVCFHDVLLLLPTILSNWAFTADTDPSGVFLIGPSSNLTLLSVLITMHNALPTRKFIFAKLDEPNPNW